VLNERSRHQLYDDLKGVITVESADELMAYLPPVGWADVATKSDLEMLRLEMRADMADLKTDLHRWTITVMFAMTGLFGAFVVGVAKFVH